MNQYPGNLIPKDLGMGYCLNGTNGNETLCEGDSGGPAFWEDKDDFNRAYLVGIASTRWTVSPFQQCGDRPIQPGKFSRVNIAKTLNWLLVNSGTDLEDCLLEQFPFQK